MPGNQQVFISHAHEDNDRCAPLLAALDAWGVDYWFDTARMDAGDNLSARINQAIAERDVFLRICTPATMQSYWMQLETGAFRGLQAREHRTERANARRLINLILDAGYVPDPLDYATVFINAHAQPQAAWLAELRRALGLAVSVTSPTKSAPDAMALKAHDSTLLQRRMPIYLLIDTSGSMTGVPIKAVNEGLHALRHKLMADPSYVDIIHISIITFSSAAECWALEPITAWSVPQLEASGSTSLGAALALLNHSLDNDIIPTRPDTRGDYKPLVFLLTDGMPTDEWRTQAMRLAQRKVNVVAIGLGTDVNQEILKQFATNTFLIPTVTAEAIASLFQWIHISFRSVSRAVHAANDPQLQLPTPPGIIIA